MKISKIFTDIVFSVISAASFFSCSNLLSDSSSEKLQDSNERGIITLSGSLSLPENCPSALEGLLLEDNSDRAAFPSFSSSYEFFIKDENGFEKTFSESSYSIELLLNKSYRLTAGLKVKDSDDDPVMISSSWSVTPTRDNAGTSEMQHDFVLFPAESGSGYVKLKITLDDDVKSLVAAVAVSSENNELKCLGSSPEYYITASGTEDIDNLAAIDAGQYEVTINFYDSNSILLYSISQAINVFASMTTDRWISASSAEPFQEESFILTKEHLNSFARTQIYVGTTDVGIASDGGSGSPYEPFTSMSKALSMIKKAGNTSIDYTIHLSGEVTETLTLSSDFDSKANSITIKGTSGSDKDIIDGNYEESVILIESSCSVTIYGVTIKNGSSSLGGGISIQSEASVTLDGGTIVTSNTAERGGGISVGNISSAKGGKLILKSCKIYENTANGWGGGIYCEDGSKSVEVEISGPDVEIYNNTADFSSSDYDEAWSAQGGGIAIGTNGSVTLYSGKIYGNSALLQGGGVKIMDEKARFIMNGGQIYENASKNGGGIHNSCNSSDDQKTYGLIMTGGKIYENTTDGKGGAIYNSGIFNLSGSACIPAGNDYTGDYTNDVYLASDKVITLAGELTGTAPVVTITPSSWTKGTIILQADGTNISDLTTIENITDFFAFTAERWEAAVSDTKTSLYIDNPIYVSAAGSSDGDGSRNSPMDSIENACTKTNDSSSAFTIRVLGTLTEEQIVPDSGINAASLTLEGANGLDEDGNPKDALTLSQTGTILTVNTTIPLTLKNIKIQGSEDITKPTIGLKVENSAGAAVTISNGVLITKNYTSGFGGGLSLGNNCTLTMTGGKISGNKASSGGGVYLNGNSSMFTMTGGEISENLAETDGERGLGGAVYLGGDVYLGGPSITFNLSGSASIPAGNDGRNDVYLSSSAVITISADIGTSAPALTLTPAVYSEETTVLSGSFLQNNYTKIAVSKNPDDKDYNWITTSTGTIKKVIGTKTGYTFKDIVFADGSTMPYTSGMSLSTFQRQKVIAFIACKYNDYFYGVGLRELAAKPWVMDSDLAGYQSVSTSDSDGLSNMRTIKSLSDYSDSDSESNYPAFYWADNYCSVNHSGIQSELGSLASDWFIPSVKELQAVLGSNASDMAAFFNTVLGTSYASSFSTSDYYMSSTQDTTASNIKAVRASSSSSSESKSKTANLRVRAVRKFQ